MHAPTYEETRQENSQQDFPATPHRQLKVMPNPATDRISIQCDSEVVLAVIYTFTGQKVVSTSATEIDISHLPTGIYILSVTSVNGTERTMFIKQ